MEVIEIFAERLVEKIGERGIGQSEFARRVGISRNNINKYCLGRRRPTIDTVVLMCKELGVSADYLLGLKDY